MSPSRCDTLELIQPPKASFIRARCGKALLGPRTLLSQAPDSATCFHMCASPLRNSKCSPIRFDSAMNSSSDPVSFW